MAHGKVETDYIDDYIAGMSSLHSLFLKFGPKTKSLFGLANLSSSIVISICETVWKNI
jgi:hypothetical protein